MDMTLDELRNAEKLALTAWRAIPCDLAGGAYNPAKSAAWDTYAAASLARSDAEQDAAAMLQDALYSGYDSYFTE